MSEWKEYKLGEITTEIGDGIHGTPNYSETGEYYFINGNNIVNGKVVIKSDTKKVDSEQFQKYRKPLSDRTILLSINGTIGSVGYYNNEKCILGKSACYLNIKDTVDKHFVYYVFLSDDFQNHLQNIATGTTIQNVPLKGLRESIISLPPLETQRRIASILSSLDDKIDLLYRENATLEQMAETMFRQWFVVEAKEEWEEGKLGDYVELVNGVSYKGDELQPSNVAMVTLKSFDRNGGFRMDGYKEFTGKFKKEQVLYDGDLVVAHTDITQEADVIGNPVIVIGKNQYETITFSMDVVKVVSKSEFFSNSFLYYLMKTQAFKEHCLGYANGSTVLHLSKKAIPEFEFYVPPKEILHHFQEQAESINKMILNNNNEIHTLSETRDGLLPKLMLNEIAL
jgi:Restriction endonuclease S subunits